VEYRWALQYPYNCCQVEYITLPGWQTSIEDVRDYEKLPHNAKKYIQMIEENVQVPGTYVALSLYNSSL
jgi:adenylosuccinate synthase